MIVQCTRDGCLRAVERNERQVSRARHTFCSPECRIHFYRVERITQAWNAVDRHGAIPDSHPEYGNCWIYPSKLNANGYASATLLNGRSGLAHRLALENKVGQLPEGFFACHTCDVRNCVRNDNEGVYEINGVLRVRWGHLYIGTFEDNMADRSARSRLPRGQDAWSARHPELVAHGSQSGKSKLTEDAVADIRRLYAAGSVSYRELGLMFTVAPSTIGGIVNRREWRHVK